MKEDTQRYKQFLYKAKENAIKVVYKPKYAHEQMTLECLKCNNTFTSSLRAFLENPVCLYCCSKKKLHNAIDLAKRIHVMYKGEYEIIPPESKEFNHTVKFKIIHTPCNSITTASLTSITNGKFGCRLCSGIAKLNYEDVKKYFQNEGYTLLEKDYINTESKMLVRHNACGNEYYTNFHNFSSGHRCLKCFNLNKTSKGIKAIIEILQSLNIEYIFEKTYKKYSYDLYLPKQNLLIEFDGEQHFISTKFFQGLDELSSIMKRDFIKNFIAKNILKCHLLRVDYTMLLKESNLKEFLTQYLENIPTLQVPISSQASNLKRRRFNDYRKTSEGKNLVEYALSKAEMEGFHLNMEEDIVWSLS